MTGHSQVNRIPAKTIPIRNIARCNTTTSHPATQKARFCPLKSPRASSRRVRAELPTKDVWCYTGCVLEDDLLKESRWRTEVADEMLSCIDVLVDGPFIEELKDVSLKFRGSSNQRILRLKEL